MSSNDGIKYIINYTAVHKESLATSLHLQATNVPGEHYLTVLDNLLTKRECSKLIRKANDLKTDSTGNKSWHTPGTGGSYMRVMMVDRTLADELFSRIKPYLPTTYNGYQLHYLNDHFRFSRYNKGGQFPLHMDGQNYDASRPHLTGGHSAVSLFTLNIFLNDDFEGGETDFYNDASTKNLRYSVKPLAGRGALFWARQYHCGNMVKTPYKYLLRTDVMGS